MKNYMKSLREKEHLSQERLAFELNVSRQTIISIEKGKYDPSLSLAILIAKRFNCKVEDIFIYEEDQ